MTEFWKGEKEHAEQNAKLLKNKLEKYVNPNDIPMVRAIVDQLKDEEERAVIAEEELKRAPTQN